MVRGPDIDMSPGEDLQARSEALEGAVQAAAAAGLRDSHVERLCEVNGRRWNAFRRRLRRGGPPLRVEPLRDILKPGARPVKARPRVYNPVKTAWLAACMTSLAALGHAFHNFQARTCWPVQPWLRKKSGFRMVSDYRDANQQVEKVPGTMPNQEASKAKLIEA